MSKFPILLLAMVYSLSADIVFSNTGIYTKKNAGYELSSKSNKVPALDKTCFGLDVQNISEIQDTFSIKLTNPKNKKMFEVEKDLGKNYKSFIYCLKETDLQSYGKWTFSVSSIDNISSNLFYFDIQSTIMSINEINKFITEYKGNNEDFIKFIKSIKTHEQLSNDKEIARIGSFISFVISKNPLLINDIKKLNLSDNDTKVIIHALWFSSIENQSKLMSDFIPEGYVNSKKYLDKLYIDSFANILTQKITSSTIAGQYWAAYYATGDFIYLNRIIDSLILLDSTDDKEKALGKELRWSIIENATENKEVYLICKNYKSTLKSDFIIKSIIKSLEVDLQIKF